MARFQQKGAEQERPSRQPASGKDRAYKAGWLKSRGAGEGVRGAGSTREGVKENALEGSGPALIELVKR